MKLKVLAGLAAATIVAPAAANAQTVVTSPNTPVVVGGITDFNTFFNELGGMKITWYTGTGGCAAGCSGTWGSLGGGTWGVTSSTFSLTAQGSLDTYGIGPLGYRWDLSGKNITKFTIDPTAANAVFDITAFPEQTPGSSLGNEFQLSGCFLGFCVLGDQWNTVATYSNPVSVGPAPFGGDLYDFLTVSFGKNFGSSRSAAEALFTQDLDQVTGGFSTPQEVAPEPGVMGMLATGLVGMAGFAGRRRRN